MTGSTAWLRLLTVILFGAYVALFMAEMRQNRLDAAAGLSPSFTDFTSTYASSMLLRSEPAANLYNAERMFLAQQLANQRAYDDTLDERQARRHYLARFQYPPTFVPYLMPLSYLSYAHAQAVWLTLTAIPFLVAVGLTAGWRLGLPLALCIPPVFFNMVYGQTGFLVAGYFGLGLLFLPKRPLLAGLCLGLASIKPHFGILVPLALIAGGHWRALATATLTVCGMVVATLLLFGTEAWLGFLATTLQGLGDVTGTTHAWNSSVSAAGAVQLAGASGWGVWAAQAAALTIAVAAVLWGWRRRGAQWYPRQAGLLCAAALLASPTAYLYDLLLLAPAAAWLVVDLRRLGAEAWEEVAAVLALGMTILHLEAAETLGVSLGFVAVITFVALFVRRLHRRQPPAGVAG